MNQTISIGFYAITDFSETMLQTAISTEECAWFNIDSIQLEFDHNEMVQEAVYTMRLHFYPIG